MNAPAEQQQCAPRYTYAQLKSSLNLQPAKRIARKDSNREGALSTTPQILIAPGSRNAVLMRFAGLLRRQGLGREQIESILAKTNEEITSEPLDAAEVADIAKSVSRYQPSDQAAMAASLTDTGNADRFVAMWHHTVKYVPEWKKWMMWDSGRWLPDDVQNIIELAKTTARSILAEAAGLADRELQGLVAKHALQSQRLERLRAMVKLAESMPEIIVRATDLDKDVMLFGVQNGVIDLKSGALRPAKPADYITRQAPVIFDSSADCQVFKRFLSAVSGNKEELVGYLQRIMGYGLTGATTEDCLFFFYGAGANGKSTLLNVIKELLGPDYCKQTAADTLMARAKGGAPTNDIARLEGARVALSNEVEEGSRLAETLIKQLTGRDPIAVRYLYKEFFEFVPQFKIIIAGNHQPVVRGEDTGIWRRLKIVPFEVTIPLEQRDHTLPDKLRAELPGILNFAIQGCLRWQANGLQAPKEVEQAISEYKSEMDILGQWIEENCEVDASKRISASGAYSDYHGWAIRNGYQVLSANAFGRRLKNRHEKTKTREGGFYIGLTLKPYQSTL
jgi:putative DNA primase/helicase